MLLLVFRFVFILIAGGSNNNNKKTTGSERISNPIRSVVVGSGADHPNSIDGVTDNFFGTILEVRSESFSRLPLCCHQLGSSISSDTLAGLICVDVHSDRTDTIYVHMPSHIYPVAGAFLKRVFKAIMRVNIGKNPGNLASNFSLM